MSKVSLTRVEGGNIHYLTGVAFQYWGICNIFFFFLLVVDVRLLHSFDECAMPEDYMDVIIN